jgi:hypothetical protein
VRVHHVDATLAHELPERTPDGRIERVALANLHVVDGALARAVVDREGRIALGADVADRHGHVGAAAPGRAQQDRLVGPSAGATHAAELEDADGRASQFESAHRFADHCFVSRSIVNAWSGEAAGDIRVAAAAIASQAAAPTTDQS